MKRFALLFLFLAILVFCLVSCTSGNCEHPKTLTKEVLPTCSEEGFLLHVCPYCGYHYKSDYVSPQGHDMLCTVIPPGCETEGYTAFSCKICGYSYQAEFTAPSGHKYQKEEILPTCTEAGCAKYTCTVCGNSYSLDYESPTGHPFKKELVLPTCTDGGYTEYTCKVCSFSYRSDYVGATGHHFLATAVSPTLKSPGYLHQVCSACGNSFHSDPISYGELLVSAGNTDSKVLAKGVDLSHHNGNVDFAALKRAGISFVLLRAGFSGSGKDSKFETYYREATAVGLEIGCYLYTESLSVAGIQTSARRLLEYLDGKKLSYPIYLDMETDAQRALPAATLVRMAKAFAEILLDAGYFPGLYTNPDWLKSVYGTANDPSSFLDIWLAHHNPGYYNKDPNYYAGKYALWQYCGTENTDAFETIPGIDGRVDIDVCYKDYPAIIKTYGYNGY